MGKGDNHGRQDIAFLTEQEGKRDGILRILPRVAVIEAARFAEGVQI